MLAQERPVQDELFSLPAPLLACYSIPYGQHSS